MVKPEYDQQVNKINHQINTIHAEILAARTHPEEWYPLFLKASGTVWHEISRLLMELLKIGHPAFDLKSIAELQEVTAQIERQHAAVHHTITELVPVDPSDFGFASSVSRILILRNNDSFTKFSAFSI